MKTEKEQLVQKAKNSEIYQDLIDFKKKVKVWDFNFTPTKKEIIVMISIVIGIFLADQVTKFIANYTMMEGQNYEIIDNFFYFTYVHNDGMAWSLFRGMRWLFVICTTMAIGVMFYFFCMTKKHEVLTRYGLVIVLGGTLGNLIDRIVLGYVRDFIHFYIFNYDFPIFNVADIAVVLGIGMIILEIIIQEYQIWKLSKSL